MKLLKSKGFVFFLVIVAIGFATKNVILPLLDLKGSKGRSADLQTKSIREEISPVSVTSETIDPIPLTVLEGVSWFLDNRRDPFKKLNSLKDAVVDSDRKLEHKQTIDPVVIDKNLILEGIMIEPGKRFVVINGEIVTEGDDYNDYKVISIDGDLVKLKGPSGYQNLTLSEKMF